jgi:hypothetical protein
LLQGRLSALQTRRVLSSGRDLDDQVQRIGVLAVDLTSRPGRLACRLEFVEGQLGPGT